MSPSKASQIMNKGLAAHRAGRLDEARRCYQDVLRHRPGNAQALNLLGLVAAAQGRARDAVALYRTCLKGEPRFAAAWSNLGAALLADGLPADAAAAHRKAVQLEPGLAAAHNNLGTALSAQGLLDEAAAAFARAVQLEPDMAEAHNNLGNVRKEQAGLAEAAAHYARALELRPGYADAWCNLANVLLELGEPAEAEAAYARSLSLDPLQAKAHHGRSNALRALGRPDEALAACRAAIELQPGHAEAHSALGCLLQASRRWDEALAAHRSAISLGGQAEAWNNLGNCLLALNRTQEALGAYREARTLQPASPDIAFNESIVHLLEGRLREGWEGYERRWDLKVKNLRRRPVQSRPAWDGRETLEGRSIAVYAEQGLGDTFQFARYIPLLAERGARVHAVVQASARSLIGRIRGVQSTGTADRPWPDCDLHCPLLSLPRAFGTGADSIPAGAPYLAPRPDRVRAAAEWLAGAGPLRIGAVWAGNPGHPNDANRSIPLADLSRPLTQAAQGWASLQKDLRPGEAELLAQAGAVDLSARLADFEDTAGALAQLDLLISVDTAVAHLAGSMGVSTWILLPFSPDWRWMLGREDSPWYPSVRLFRQSEPGDWGPVLARVASELAKKRCRRVA